MAMLVGNNDSGWKFITKDGTSSIWGYMGPPVQSTIDAVESERFATVQDFLCSEFNNDKDHPGESEYHQGLRIETDEETDEKIINAATKGALQTYHVLQNNCMQNCVNPLVSNGLLPHRFAELVRPNIGFSELINTLTGGGSPYNTELFQNYSGGDFSVIHENLPNGDITLGEGWTVPVNEEGWFGYRPKKADE